MRDDDKRVMWDCGLQRIYIIQSYPCKFQISESGFSKTLVNIEQSYIDFILLNIEFILLYGFHMLQY